MKRIVLSLLALGLVVLGLAGIAPSILSRVGVQTAVQADTEKTISVPSSRTQPIKLDVACDCRTFAYNRGAVFPDVVRGDGFIVNGKIFPPGTLPTGTAANDPNDPGSIGDWICRGTNTGVDDPGAFVTQYHLLANGRGLVSEGAARVPEGQAAVVGGLGEFSGASGQQSGLVVGTNSTGCPNIRFTFHLKKQAPK